MAAEEIDGETIDFGTTEYILITMWAIFTAGVFGILYKITMDAEEELHGGSTAEKKADFKEFRNDSMDIRYAETEEDI